MNIVLIILFLYALIMLNVFRENYSEYVPKSCSRCGNRIVTAAVYASEDPNIGYSGLGWIV
jgi:hypothetical protein